MPEYSPNLNIEKALGTENVNRAYFMRVIDDIDEKVGVANGLAKLDANGNVLKADGTQAGEVTKTQFETHTGQAATTLKVGHVQLSDAVTSTDVTKAATSNAVKKAYDRADAAFTSASNGKTSIKNAVTGADSRVVVPTDPTFDQLAAAVGQIKTGPKKAVGSARSSTTTVQVRNALKGSHMLPTVTVTGLSFRPSVVIIFNNGIYSNAIYSDDLLSDEGFPVGFLNKNSSTLTPVVTNEIYLANGSFKLAVDTVDTNYSWIAIEGDET